jgi:hypothetical protein
LAGVRVFTLANPIPLQKCQPFNMI